MEALIKMEQEEPKSGSFFDVNIRLRDVIQLVVLLVSGVWFITSMSAKIDNLKSAIDELKDTGVKNYSAQDLAIKNLQNQVATNQIQIQLIQKDIETLKSKSK